MPYLILLNWDDNCPQKSSLVVIELKKYGWVVSGDVQTIFPYMSDACSPAMNGHMTAQNAYMPLSFMFYLRSILKEVIR